MFEDIDNFITSYWLSNGLEKRNTTSSSPIGALTLDATTLNYIMDPERPKGIVFTGGCIRPGDVGITRSLRHTQLQVLIDPKKFDISDIREKINSSFNNDNNSLQYIEDRWSNHIIGAYGYGFEIRTNSKEIIQLTRFYKYLKKECDIIEITYGLDRIVSRENKKGYKPGDGKILSSLRHLKKYIDRDSADRIDWEEVLMLIHKYNIISTESGYFNNMYYMLRCKKKIIDSYEYKV